MKKREKSHLSLVGRLKLLGWIAMLAAAIVCACGCKDQTQQIARAASETGASFYIAAKDGTRLAADVYLPSAEAGKRYPALLTLTRYRRGHEDPKTGKPLPGNSPLDLHFLKHGYALVKVDARGSGASFGTRSAEYGHEEVLDAYDVVEWVVSQTWSDGTAGAYGTSYTGTTAELLAAVNHPAVKAVIPGWSDFETYTSPVRPYGMLPRSFMKTWGELVGAMDRNDIKVLGAGTRRVDEDTDGTLLEAAIAEHSANPDVFEAVLAAEYRDDKFGNGQTWAELGPLYWKDEIENSGVPMLVLVSYMDAGTTDGTLLRFQHYSNPQKVVMLASTHGGRFHASPYTVGAKALPPQPSELEQFELRRLFFDHYLKGEDQGVDEWPPIRFFNMGEEAFHETDVWPLEGSEQKSIYLDTDGDLTGDISKVAAGTDTYEVDFGVTTGLSNRWMAQMGRPILNLDDRGDMDARMLTYTTEPLPDDVQIAGYPVVTLQLESDNEDGAVFVYLEDVDPDGKSRYLTEGGIRLIHRKTVPNPYFETDLPYHSYARAEAEPMPPGQAVEVSFQLWPIVVLIRAGHRIRIAIAGADADMFDPIPAKGIATLTIHRGGDNPSRMTLPVVPGGLKSPGTAFR